MNGAESLVGTLAEAGVEVRLTSPGITELHPVGARESVPRMRGMLALFEARSPEPPTVTPGSPASRRPRCRRCHPARGLTGVARREQSWPDQRP
ncbi:hypothetical protein [Micromonospora sp. WMMD812]|uniref:hypothetical protein n=1 Tax=Micromonospora sp. WMMD812 TaxID=3015152 RepID=UPI00248AC7A8|nr:hypothetical protein [Micromonospora sp. WMMD812]WBB70000.1 hypothetical protein O7603_11830 [Micromonospora sp. WMMD812]